MKERQFFSKKGWPCIKRTFEIGDKIENATVIERTKETVTISYPDNTNQTLNIETSTWFQNGYFNRNHVMVSALMIEERINENELKRFETKIEKIARKLQEQFGNTIPFETFCELNLSSREENELIYNFGFHVDLG